MYYHYMKRFELEERKKDRGGGFLMLKDVEGLEFQIGDKVAIKKEVREYMEERYNESPRVYPGDPYFIADMWLAVRDMKYLTIKRIGYTTLEVEEEKHNYDARWFEYYLDKLKGAEDF